MLLLVLHEPEVQTDEAEAAALRSVLAHQLLQWSAQVQGAFGTIRANGDRMTPAQLVMMLDIGENATHRITGVLDLLVRGLPPESVLAALEEAQTLNLTSRR